LTFDLGVSVFIKYIAINPFTKMSILQTSVLELLRFQLEDIGHVRGTTRPRGWELTTYFYSATIICLTERILCKKIVKSKIYWFLKSLEKLTSFVCLHRETTVI